MAKSIIDALLEKGLVSDDQVAVAQEISEQGSSTAIRVLVDRGWVNELQVCEIVAESAGMPFVDPEMMQADPAAALTLPGEWARKLHALPYAIEDDRVLVAVDDPTTLHLLDDLSRLTGYVPVLALSPSTSLLDKIEKTYRDTGELDEITEEFEDTELLDETASEEDAESAPVVRYVNSVLQQAILDRASDVHIDPTDSNVVIKFRIDGVLHEQMTSPRTILPLLVSRIKIMANLDISEKRVPQDGRISLRVSGRTVDLRVTTLPTVHGEKIVLRIIDNAQAPLDLSSVGLSSYHQHMYENEYTRPHGMILVTGPTGCGKSTTLYATLNALKRPEINILTVEDPVEYRMAGVSQIQINKKAGLSFATALRSILRADPDVLLVGEIRDTETAKISVEASLTGHLVLSTLHTNDAASAITRLVEMGIEPFLVGSALSMVVAQRLLRRLCLRCAREYEPEPDLLQSIGYPWKPGTPLPVLKEPVGCERCSHTGYRGRTAIYEMLPVDATIERMASSGAHADQIRDAAVEKGMRLIRADGWEKVSEGQTSIAEVLRVSL